MPAQSRSSGWPQPHPGRTRRVTGAGPTRPAFLPRCWVATRGLMPEVHGITDVNSFADWDAPFRMEPVTPRDEAYWKKYRATPKAFVTLKTAQHLWQNRYGDLTSLRITPVPGKTLDESRELL